MPIFSLLQYFTHLVITHITKFYLKISSRTCILTSSFQNESKLNLVRVFFECYIYIINENYKTCYMIGEDTYPWFFLSFCFIKVEQEILWTHRSVTGVCIYYYHLLCCHYLLWNDCLFGILDCFQKDDLTAVVNYLRNDGNVSLIGLWGRSMGAVTW
jgi:hypothetical protein